jgi:hypothetical protein
MELKKIIILIILFILFVVITITGVLIYNSSSQSPTKCPVNKDSFYDFKEVQLGADILRSIKEGFSFIKN